MLMLVTMHLLMYQTLPLLPGLNRMVLLKQMIMQLPVRELEMAVRSGV